jgi:hypothetical protein
LPIIQPSVVDKETLERVWSSNFSMDQLKEFLEILHEGSIDGIRRANILLKRYIYLISSDFIYANALSEPETLEYLAIIVYREDGEWVSEIY